MRKIIFPLLTIALAVVSLFAQDSTRVLIVYYSQRGHTAAMAKAVAEGASSVTKVAVKNVPVNAATNRDVLQADAIILGSPVYNANVAPALQKFINRWPFKGRPLKNKIGAAFVTAGGFSAGEETVQLNLLKSMLIFGMIVVGGDDWQSAFGASAVTEEEPFKGKDVAPQFLRKAKELGRRVAQIAQRMKTKPARHE